ncbi:MAG: helix-turn-helix domain-containing protein [Verrucomicrobiota bacterium]|nr:helix-turn-helix domain-containing protein [Verrucomicrobiota bacterium]
MAAASIDPILSRQVAARWTPALIASGGFTPISVFFLENYSALPLPLTHGEALLVIHLMRHKFDRQAPYPGFATLARRMGVTPTAVRGYARSLERKGYLQREMRLASTNKFHLEPLFRALERMLVEKVEPLPLPSPLQPSPQDLPANLPAPKSTGRPQK